MIKFLSYFSAFLCLVVFILSSLYIDRGTEIEKLETRINAYRGNVCYLEKTIEESNRKKLETSYIKKENNKQIEKDNSGFRWDYDLSNNPVLLNFKRLHKNRVRLH